MNSVNLIGRLTSDPEVRELGEGTKVSSFSLAINRRLSNEKKEAYLAEGRQTADFPRIQAWGKKAEIVEKYVKKGDLVGISGEIRTGSYTNDAGVKMYTTDIQVQHLRFLNPKNPAAQTLSDENAESENIPF